MHAFLIIGGTKEERDKKIQEFMASWTVSQFDQHILTPEDGKESIGIEHVRVLIKQLSLSPRNSPFVIGVIPNAHILTPQAQNALLKTLEEPPPKAKLILETENPSLLLPTIVSRVNSIAMQKSSISSDTTSLELLTFIKGKTHGEILHIVDTEFPTKKTAENWTMEVLLPLARMLEQTPNKAIAMTIQYVLKAQQQLHANVNHKLVIDTFFFSCQDLDNIK